MVPGRLGKLRVQVNADEVVITTSNVRRISVAGPLSGKRIVVDSSKTTLDSPTTTSTIHLIKLASGWQAGDHTPAAGLGGLDAILRTKGPFNILQCDDASAHVSAQVARNMLQYFKADSAILTPHTHANAGKGNTIVVGIGDSIRDFQREGSPLEVGSEGVEIAKTDGEVVRYEVDQDGLGAIFLMPSADQSLKLVVWGVDADSLQVAARLVPMVSGAGQPDFIVTSRRMLSEGAGGARAMGFVDGQWRIQAAAAFFS